MIRLKKWPAQNRGDRPYVIYRYPLHLSFSHLQNMNIRSQNLIMPGQQRLFSNRMPKEITTKKWAKKYIYTLFNEYEDFIILELNC